MLFGNKGMLLRNKGMLLHGKGMLLHDEYKTMTNDRWQFQNNAHHTTQHPYIKNTILFFIYLLLQIFIIIYIIFIV